MSTNLRLLTIISGGQTGADRAALDFALQHGLPHGGWCPRGRLAEDGRIPPHYVLREAPTRRYAVRTAWNVRDSDATVAFTIAPVLSGGTGLTLQVAERLQKPWLHLSREALAAGGVDPIEQAAANLREFLSEHQVASLNVAGPRASQEPDIAEFVCGVLLQALGDYKQFQNRALAPRG